MPPAAAWHGRCRRFRWRRDTARPPGSSPGSAVTDDDATGRGVEIRAVLPHDRLGSYSSNAAGLSDVVGNLWEWTEDCWEGDCGRGAP